MVVFPLMILNISI